MNKKNIKSFLYFFFLFFILTTILHLVTGFHSRWDFGFYKLTFQEYLDVLFPRGMIMLVVTAIVFTILSDQVEKGKKNIQKDNKDNLDENEKLTKQKEDKSNGEKPKEE